MTLLVGVRYNGGAVIAADKQATHGTIAVQTVGQPVTKIKILGQHVLFASSGPVGIGQQFETAILGVQAQFHTRKCSDMVALYQKKFREILDPAFQTAGLAARVVGAAAQAEVMSGSLLAAKFKDGIFLADISAQANVELLTSDIPFVCLGSGKQNADPFLRYIWSVFFADGSVTESDAALAAYWTVRTAIDLKSPGVGFDVDVFVVNASGAKQLTAAELEGHLEFIRAAETALRSVKDTIKGAAGEEIPPPPVLNPNP